MVIGSRGKSFKPIKRRKRYLRKWFKQEGLCAYCEGRMALADVTFDHVIPLSKGGTDKDTNVVLAHYSCNQEKDDKIIQPLRR